MRILLILLVIIAVFVVVQAQRHGCKYDATLINCVLGKAETPTAETAAAAGRNACASARDTGACGSGSVRSGSFYCKSEAARAGGRARPLQLRPVKLSDRNEQQLNALGQEQRRANEIITQKNKELDALSTKLSKYLSPQIYHSIFTGAQNVEIASSRKKLTIFFSDVVNFTETTDKLESEDLTNLLNRYLTEMTNIALEHGATIDKYIGDAIMVFFGDPESRGVKEDARACVRMAIAMLRRLRELRGVA